MEKPTTLVIQSEKSVHYQQSGKEVILSYQLSAPLVFQEPHFARLLWLGGDSAATLVFADFVERQEVNGEKLQYLGCSATGSLCGWVPLASDYIPHFGFLFLRHANWSTAYATKKFTVIIEIAPLSWINGTSR